MPLLAPQDELEALNARSSERLSESILEGATAILHGDLKGERRAMMRSGELVAAGQGIADLFGRRRVWLEIDHVLHRPGSRSPHRAAYAMSSVFSPVIPQVPFKEAVEDLLSREPRLATGGSEVAHLYSQEHAFAVARSLDLTVTKKVQESIARVLQEGGDRDREVQVLSRLEGWTPGYAATVQRTNLSTAYNGGRFRQTQDPAIDDVIIGLRRVATLDSDCRPNHRKAHGFTASQYDPVWNYMGLPWGFNERCGLELVDRFEALREGLLVAGKLPPGRPVSAPDPGFRGAATGPRMGAYAAPVLRLPPAW